MDTLYNKVNDRCFDSKLPHADIILFDALDIWTYIMLEWDYAIDGIAIPPEHYGSWIIGIGQDLTKEEKIATMIHEMIHIWQGETGREMDHGKEFERKCQFILEKFEP